MKIKKDCLKMLNSMEQNVMIPQMNKRVIFNGEEVELKYENEVPYLLEYLKSILNGEVK